MLPYIPNLTTQAADGMVRRMNTFLRECLEGLFIGFVIWPLSLIAFASALAIAETIRGKPFI